MALTQNNYPITKTLLGDLLQKDLKAPAPIFTPLQPNDADQKTFQLMPQVPHPKKKRPPPAKGAAIELTDMESMIDLFLIGKDNQGRPEIHLSLKDEIVDGLYIRLQKKYDDGFHALFIVKTYSMKNQLGSNIETLVHKLKEKGSKIISHEIIVGDTIPDVDLTS